MASRNLISLTRLRPGDRGFVAEIQGGFNFNARLNALGLMPGKRMTKISSMMGQGPVTIEIDRVQLAIGYRMANRIIIDLDRIE